MFITKKYLSRRTLLRGLGVSISLPFLESMVPAQTALAQDGGESQDPPHLYLRAARRHHGQMDAGYRRHGL